MGPVGTWDAGRAWTGVRVDAMVFSEQKVDK